MAYPTLPAAIFLLPILLPILLAILLTAPGVRAFDPRCPVATEDRARELAERAAAFLQSKGAAVALPAFSPDFSPQSRPASRPDVRSARSGPKSVAGPTVEARDAAGGRLGATRRAALSNRQGASSRLPDVPASRGAAFLPCRFDSAAQTMTVVRNPG